MDTSLPTDPDDLTADLLNHLIGEQLPGVALADFKATESQAVDVPRSPDDARRRL